MSVLTQGTNIYFVHPTTYAVTTVDCATSFSPGGSPSDQIEDTCLEDSTRSYKGGLRTPGTASLGVNADPANASHILMHTLSETDPQPVLQWVVGWSDGTAAPTADTNGNWDGFPTTRTWFSFEGYISDFPFDFTQNTVVTSTVSIQRSGTSTWTAKV